MKSPLTPIGTIVKIKDGSWMFTIDQDGNRKHGGKYADTGIIGRCKDDFAVLEHGNYGDDGNKLFSHNRDCNTKLVHLKTGEVWYANEAVSLTIVKEPKGSTRVVLIPVEVPSDGSDYKVTVSVTRLIQKVVSIPVKIKLWLF